MTFAVGNLSARYLELTPTEHPMSRMSSILDVCECCRWCCSIALSQFPRRIWVASSTEEAVGIARLTIDLVAASASAAAYHHITQTLMISYNKGVSGVQHISASDTDTTRHRYMWLNSIYLFFEIIISINVSDSILHINKFNLKFRQYTTNQPLPLTSHVRFPSSYAWNGFK